MYPKKEAEGNLRPKKRRLYEDKTERFDDAALEDRDAAAHQCTLAATRAGGSEKQILPSAQPC